MTPLMKLCVYDGKLEDIKKILDENSELISKVSLKLMSTSVILSPNTKSRCANDYDTPFRTSHLTGGMLSRITASWARHLKY